MIAYAKELIEMKNVYVNKAITIVFILIKLVFLVIIHALNVTNNMTNVLNVYLIVIEFIIQRTKNVIVKFIFMIMVMLFVLNVIQAV